MAMIRVLLVTISLLDISAAYSQRPLKREVGDESFITVTDSMLRHERIVYTAPEISPSYPGGQDAFDLFIKKNLKYPAIAIEHQTQGRVMVRFIVEKSGRLSHVTIARDIGDGCGEEAVRLVKKCRKWNPGRINNIPVRTQFSIGVKFITPD